jgi:membrane protein implicated in regulation of membrane protease activity
MFWIWLIVIILLTIAEIMTVNLVTIWFVISAIVSLVLSFFIDSFNIQFFVFVILGVILLITTRQTLEQLVNKRKQRTNIDRIIGMTGVVIEEIKKNKNGAVKVDGKVWTATSDKNIKVDSIVKVLEIQSTKIKVEEE